MSSVLFAMVDKQVALCISKGLNNNIIRLIIQFLSRHPCASILAECPAMLFRISPDVLKSYSEQPMILSSPNSTMSNPEFDIPVFDVIRFGLYEPTNPDTYSRWLGNNPTTTSYFTACNVIRPSVDYRPKDSFGSRGRKGSGKGSGKGKGYGTHIGPVVLSVYNDIHRGIMETTEYRKKTGRKHDVYRF